MKGFSSRPSGPVSRRRASVTARQRQSCPSSATGWCLTVGSVTARIPPRVAAELVVERALEDERQLVALVGVPWHRLAAPYPHQRRPVAGGAEVEHRLGDAAEAAPAQLVEGARQDPRARGPEGGAGLPGPGGAAGPAPGARRRAGRRAAARRPGRGGRVPAARAARRPRPRSCGSACGSPARAPGARRRSAPAAAAAARPRGRPEFVEGKPFAHPSRPDSATRSLLSASRSRDFTVPSGRPSSSAIALCGFSSK